MLPNDALLLTTQFTNLLQPLETPLIKATHEATSLLPSLLPAPQITVEKTASLKESIITSTSFLTTESVINPPKDDSNPSSTRSSKVDAASPESDVGLPDEDHIEADHADGVKLTEEQLKDAVIDQGYLYRLKSGYPKTWKKCIII
jgi:hypothetical protein